MFMVLHAHSARKLGDGSASRCGRGAWGLWLSPSREPRAWASPGGAVPKLLRGAGLAGALSNQGHCDLQVCLFCAESVDR